MEIVASLERSVHLVAVRLGPVLAELELTQAEAHVLSRLHRGAPVSVNELHRLFGHRRSTLTGVLDRLEARRLIRRLPNPDDRRSVLVSLTRSGGVVARNVAAAVDALEQEVGSRCSPSELEGFAAVVAAIER